MAEKPHPTPKSQTGKTCWHSIYPFQAISISSNFGSAGRKAPPPPQGAEQGKLFDIRSILFVQFPATFAQLAEKLPLPKRDTFSYKEYYPKWKTTCQLRRPSSYYCLPNLPKERYSDATHENRLFCAQNVPGTSSSQSPLDRLLSYYHPFGRWKPLIGLFHLQIRCWIFSLEISIHWVFRKKDPYLKQALSQKTLSRKGAHFQKKQVFCSLERSQLGTQCKNQVMQSWEQSIGYTMIKPGHMVLKVVNWAHNTKIRSYGLESCQLGTQYKNQVIWSWKQSIGYTIQKSGHMVLKAVNWVQNDKLGKMVLKGVIWVHYAKIRPYGLERSQLCTQWLSDQTFEAKWHFSLKIRYFSSFSLKIGPFSCILSDNARISKDPYPLG